MTRIPTLFVCLVIVSSSDGAARGETPSKITAAPSPGTYKFPLKVKLFYKGAATIRYTTRSRDVPPKCTAGKSSAYFVYGSSVDLAAGASIWAVACNADNSPISDVSKLDFNEDIQTANCFSEADAVRLPYRFMLGGTAPSQNDPRANNHPVSDVLVGPKRVNPNADPHIRQYVSQMANRCNNASGREGDYDGCFGFRGRRGNLKQLRDNRLADPFVDKDGYTVGARFSSYRTADACTLAQVAKGLGYETSKIELLTHGTALKVVTDQARTSELQLVANGQHFDDVCVLPPPYDPRVKGVSLDFEVHDGRTPEMTRSFLTTFVNLIHGKSKEAILRANPLNAYTQQSNSGMRGNENYLQSIFDLIDIEMPRHGQTDDFERSFDAQVALLKRGPAPFSFSRVFLLARPAEVNTVELANVVRKLMVRNGIPLLAFNGTPMTLGGACDRPVNQIIKILTAPVSPQ